MREFALALALFSPLWLNSVAIGDAGGRDGADKRAQVERIAEAAAERADAEARPRSRDVGPPEYELDDLEAVGALLGIPPAREAFEDRALGAQRALEAMRRAIAARAARLSDEVLRELFELFEGAIIRQEGALLRIRRPRFSLKELEAVARLLERDPSLRVDLRLCCGRRTDEKRAHEALSSFVERCSIRSLSRGMRGAQLLIIREVDRKD